MYKLKVSEMRKTVNKIKSRLYHKEVLKFFFISGGEGGDSHMWCNVSRSYANYK